MPFAVEMYFDRGSEQQIRLLSDRASELGGPAAISEIRPHVSLAVADEVSPEKMGPLLLAFATHHEPFEITFAAVGFFAAQTAVAFLAPKVTHRLLDLQAELFHGLGQSASGIWEHYQPRSWVPHCTLVSGLAAKAGASVLEEVERFGLPKVCRIAEVGLVRLRPVAPILCFGFAGSPDGPGRSSEPSPGSGVAPTETPARLTPGGSPQRWA